MNLLTAIPERNMSNGMNNSVLIPPIPVSRFLSKGRQSYHTYYYESIILFDLKTSSILSSITKFKEKK